MNSYHCATLSPSILGLLSSTIHQDTVIFALFLIEFVVHDFFPSALLRFLLFEELAAHPLLLTSWLTT